MAPKVSAIGLAPVAPAIAQTAQLVNALVKPIDPTHLVETIAVWSKKRVVKRSAGS